MTAVVGPLPVPWAERHVTTLGVPAQQDRKDGAGIATGLDSTTAIA